MKVFFYESWLELKRVIWPTREDVTKMTGLVVAVVVFVGLFMYIWTRPAPNSPCVSSSAKQR